MIRIKRDANYTYNNQVAALAPISGYARVQFEI